MNSKNNAFIGSGSHETQSKEKSTQSVVAETVDIAKIKPIVGEVKILGNVSSKTTLTQGSPKEVKSEVKKAIEGGADLIEPSCGIPPETPTANIKAMVEAVKTYGRKI
jgi:[methyl-Co(III) methanol-specific corrinoid protein]:coenzyme M methyltransferase